jgi:hypothetical protein
MEKCPNIPVKKRYILIFLTYLSPILWFVLSLYLSGILLSNFDSNHLLIALIKLVIIGTGTFAPPLIILKKLGIPKNEIIYHLIAIMMITALLTPLFFYLFIFLGCAMAQACL